VTALLTQLVAETWTLLREMGPWLLLGFSVAGLLYVLIDPQTVERHLGGRGLAPVLKASAFGVPLPLCSCGVLPVAASLKQHGASRGATAAFLISTPQTGVDSIAVTYSLLGPVMAIVRPIAALVSGAIGGGVIDAADAGDGGETTSAAPAPVSRFASLPSLPVFTLPPPRRTLVGELKKALHYGFVTLPRDLARPLAWGLLAAAAIGVAIPDDFFAGTLGGGWLGMVAMMVLGIPIYVCATASVPVAAALMAKGISPGAALVFLMTGPATNTAALATIWKLLGRRSVLLYLAAIALTALAAGFLLDAFVGGQEAHIEAHHHGFLPNWLEVACAGVVLLLLAVALAPPRWTDMIFGWLTRQGESA